MTRALQLTLPGGDISLFPTTTVSSQTNFPQINVNSDGTLTYKSNGIDGLYYSPCGWYRAANYGATVPGIGSKFEARLHPTSGTFALELTDTWVSLASGTSWSRTSGNGSSVGLLEIRNAATAAVVGSTILTLTDVP